MQSVPGCMKFPQVFIQPCIFSVATGFAYFSCYRIRAGSYTGTVMLPLVSIEGMPSKDIHREARSKCPGQQKTYWASLVISKEHQRSLATTTHMSLNVKYVLIN
jgi:hypothetical protein